MGCDIHVYREAKINGKYESLDTWVDGDGLGYLDIPYEHDNFQGRDYGLFTLLATVRGCSEYSLDPKGIPEDCCDEVRAVIDGWGVDGHSHSYLTLTELKKLYVRAYNDYDYESQLCNGLDSLYDLVKLFDGHIGPEGSILPSGQGEGGSPNGEDARIVFFFDN